MIDVPCKPRWSIAPKQEDDVRLAFILEIEVDEIALLGDAQKVRDRGRLAAHLALELADSGELALRFDLFGRRRHRRPRRHRTEPGRGRVHDRRMTVRPERRAARDGPLSRRRVAFPCSLAAPHAPAAARALMRMARRMIAGQTADARVSGR